MRSGWYSVLLIATCKQDSYVAEHFDFVIHPGDH